jgi:hypothetical protein
MNQPINSQQNDSLPSAHPIDFLIDQRLAGSAEELAPSSGFVLSVMESIHAQAEEPAPIAFPWRRVMPGAFAVLCGLAALIGFGLRAFHPAKTAGMATQIYPRLVLSYTPAFTAGEMTLCWILLAACVSVAVVAASFRLTGRSR